MNWIFRGAHQSGSFSLTEIPPLLTATFFPTFALSLRTIVIVFQPNQLLIADAVEEGPVDDKLRAVRPIIKEETL